MNTTQYDKWIKSHQTRTGGVDMTEAVMNRIAQKANKPNIVKMAWQGILLDLIQARTLAKACVLAGGALMGLLRMFLQIYSVLFT
ncbi:MAG: hypothetical protein ACYSUT_03065 [Planctomycetota bacterium]|jgi:hypothetical protein